MAQLPLDVVGVISVWVEVSRSLVPFRAEDSKTGALQLLLYGSLSRHVPVKSRSRRVQVSIPVCSLQQCT